jgi:hypothetical protein
VGRLAASQPPTADCGDVYGLDHLLQAFGGMGSVSDLLLMRVNGHRIDPSQEGEINELLARLRSGIWTEATALRHALQSPDG